MRVTVVVPQNMRDNALAKGITFENSMIYCSVLLRE